MSQEIICINDTFTPEWEIYFQKNGIIKPVKDSIYTVREFINFLHGEKGVLLHEVINEPTPRIGPISGLTGNAEQAWGISRFTDLLGNPLVKEKISVKQECDISYLNLS